MGALASLDRLDGRANMALDAALLQAAEAHGAVGYRVYSWDGPWVSLGMNQDPMNDLLDPNLAPWVMRPTGGKGVLHGHDVTVAIAVPLDCVGRMAGLESGMKADGDTADTPCEVSAERALRSVRSVRSVYRFMTGPIVAALRECGLPAILAEDRAGWARDRRPIGAPRSADCFGTVSPNDVVHEKLGMKVCGCALRVTKTAALLQASIPAGPPLLDPRRVFAMPAQIVAPAWQSVRFEDAFRRALQRACPD